LQSRYRPDIDGLRAVAVVSVVLFHLGLKYIPCGFFGVDIFFVISGYLISGHIFAEAASGRFSFTRFYVRRAKRILPAMFVTSLLTALVGYILLFPSELVGFARSLIAAELFASNIYFFDTLDYFSPSAIRIPLLHYWSLGVEEQFYVLFPIAAVAVMRLVPRFLKAAVVVGFVASLAAALALAHAHPALTFYLLPFRAFELLIGSYIALPSAPLPSSGRVASWATVAGLCMIAASLLWPASNAPFAGSVAVLPCVGAALAIWGGSSAQTLPSRLLGARPLVWTGRVSYSLYLVHWPVIVFGTQLMPEMDAYSRMAVLLVASAVLAVLSYRFVEQPVRLNRLLPPRTVFGAALASVILLVGISGTAVVASGFPARFNGRVNHLVAFLSYNPAQAFREGKCFLRPEQSIADLDELLCTPKDARNEVMLWGDSAAAGLYPGLVEPLRRTGYSLAQATASACPPLLDVDAPDRPHCREFNAGVFDRVIRDRPRILLMASTWGGVAERGFDALEVTLKRLRLAGIDVFVIGPPPVYTTAVPRILADRLLSGQHSVVAADGQLLSYVPAYDERLAGLTGKMGIPYISLLGALCGSRACPLETDTGSPMEFDVLHFTPDGSDQVAAQILPFIMPRLAGAGR
jgi:peptidoglycan/LPS O-acetylase OafA/YrhL